MAQQPTDAVERLMQVATRLARAMQFALPKLPESVQVALKRRVEDGDTLWGLSLLLAGLRLRDRSEPGADEISTLMREMGASALLEDVAGFHLLLPSSFATFLTNARQADADYKLAGAGAYLVEAISSLGQPEREALQNWLRTPQFYEAARALIRRFPVPGSGRPPVWGSPPESVPTPPATVPSRAQRFDRQDFRVRPRVQGAASPSPTPPAERSTRTSPSSEAAVSSQDVPPAELDEEAKTIAYLRWLGYSQQDIDRLLAGPGRPS